MTPLNQRKTITMDYEEYLNIESRSNAFEIVITDIFNMNSLEELKTKYLEIASLIKHT